MTSVVVITVDRLPARLLGCYGSQIPTPAFDTFAANACVFDRFYAESPSASRMLEGTFDDLRSAGVVVNRIAPDRDDCDIAEVVGGRSVERSLTEVRLRAGADVESLSHEDSIELVPQVDRQLAAVMSGLATIDDCRVIVVGLGGIRCDWCPQADFDVGEDLMHLPLLVGKGRVGRSAKLIQFADISANLLGWFEQGADLTDGENLFAPAEEDASAILIQGISEVCLRTAEFCLVRSLLDADDSDRLFLQPDDPWFVHDVAVEYPATVEELSALLDGKLRASQAKPA